MSQVLDLLGSKLVTPSGEIVSTQERVASKSVLGLYFSAHWCPPCKRFTPVLAEKYKALLKAGKDFEMVFVSSDKDEKAFKEYHGEMPWLGLPHARRSEKSKLSKMFKVSGIPTLVFVDLKTGETITTDGRSGISEDNFVEAFPYHPPPPKSVFELLGPELRTTEGETVKASDALGVDVIGLYFSAHWCPPCRGFTPKLAEKYKALKSAGKSLEIVFCSSDSDEKTFNEYHAEQPWLALPYSRRAEKETLSDQFDVSGIPTLIFLDAKTEKVITDEGRSGVTSSTFIEDFPYHPKPVNDISGSLKGIQDEVSLVVLMDTSGKDAQEKVAAALNTLAAEEKAKAGKDQVVGKFFTGCGGGPIDRIRGMFDLPKQEAPLMFILDLAGDHPVYYPAKGKEEATLDNLRAFVKDHGEGKTLKKEVPK